MGRLWRIVAGACRAFYDDQMTQHASALTYYGLMSLFPVLLLGASLLGLIGEYPSTYNSLVRTLREVAPDDTVEAIDSSLRKALESKGTAAGALIVAVFAGFYGMTGVLESARRALNVVFGVEQGRSFLRRKAVDVFSACVLMALVVASLVLLFAGGALGEEVFGEIGLGRTAEDAWSYARWPLALFVALLVFGWTYAVTSDARHRRFRFFTPGVVVAVALWVGASLLLSRYLGSVGDVSALYGAFSSAIVVLVWMWLTNVALLFGAEVDAAIERELERHPPVIDKAYPGFTMLFRTKSQMVEPERALPGRSTEITVPDRHAVLGTPLKPPFPDGVETLVVGMGCFWGAERIFWRADGVYTTAVGYAGGYTENPTYEEVCSGRTGHTEAVLVAFEPAKISLDAVLRLFWENHDPTQGMRQGNDMGTQYRSAIYYANDAQREAALASREMYRSELGDAGFGDVTTEIAPAGPFYYAESYHQQYLEKNPSGYCGLGGTGVACPIGLSTGG